MKFLLCSIGTRGDMEPFLAIGEILKERGHQVLCLFPEQFRDLAEDSDFKFASLGEEFIHMLESPEGKIVMGGGSFNFKKLNSYRKLISVQSNVQKKMVVIQEKIVAEEQPDRIIFNGKCIYPVVWSVTNMDKAILISPVPYLHYVKDHAHVMFNKNLGPFLNKLTYKLANYGLLKTISGSLKQLENPEQISPKQLRKALFTNRAIYTVSPTLFSRPSYWEDHLKVLGYHERSKSINWEPDEALLQFLKSHDKILFITFGSMINTDPKGKTDIILRIIKKHRIPTIINTAAGGLVRPPEDHCELIHWVKRIPYDWILPKIYGAVHHGGSGTTHTALKNGCAILIIPHIIDQYVWNKMIHEKGAGPLGIDVSKINIQNLESLVLDLLSNPDYKKRAEELGHQISSEKLEESMYKQLIN